MRMVFIGQGTAAAPRRARPGSGLCRLLATPEAMWLLAAAGALIIAAAYRLAQYGGAPSQYYGIFWLGMLLMVTPSTARLLAKHSSGHSRALGVLSLGVVTFVPKFLRNPYGPLYHDELAHFRAVQDLLASHVLYTRNPTISIIGDFPGLHIATAAVQGLSGLAFWPTATLLMILTHCAALVAVFVLGQELLPDPRGAGLAAVLYAFNPSYLYFDTQFAYESMAMCLFLWIVALTLTALRAAGWQRSSRLALAVLLTLAGITTHHLTTLVLAFLSAVVGVSHLVFRRLVPAAHGEWRPWAVILATSAVGLLLWVLGVAHDTYDYLQPYVGSALRELAGQASGAGGGRELYSGSVQPLYERLLGMLAPPLMILAFFTTLFTTRGFRDWPARRTLLGLACFGALYFLSIPFILTPMGAEGARRSWGFTYLGLALCLAGPISIWLWAKRRNRWVIGLVPLTLAGLLVGNTDAGLNDAYRFPGPYRFGSDTRSLTTEVVSLARVFGERYPESRIVSDRYTNLALVAYGRAFSASPSLGFRTYDLFLRPTDPEPYLVHELTTSGYTYLIVDERLSKFFPLVGSYFEPDEPIQAPQGDQVSAIPQAALDRFGKVPWASKVLATSNYSVYRLNFAAVGMPSCSSPGCQVVQP